MDALAKLNKMRNSLKPLKDWVIDDIIDSVYGGGSTDKCIKDYLEGLQDNGCVSGWVTSLIYFSDTIKFFEEFKHEINELLSDTLNSSGLSILELFGDDKYDKEDPLCLETCNRNLLAWFAYEETAYQLYIRIFEN